jgi:hypothetical protein
LLLTFLLELRSGEDMRSCEVGGLLSALLFVLGDDEDMGWDDEDIGRTGELRAASTEMVNGGY